MQQSFHYAGSKGPSGQKIYHFAGHKDYGNTKNGAYMCERNIAAEEFRAAKNEKHP
jgi:hypothetical protein